ncbi:MAG: DNA repair exonuclease [Clostridia bacterium]|nr:DNA repair exonuclease [Clostridia bacterium]
MVENREKRPIRILHTGDIHLDSPFSRLRPEKSEARRREMRATFSRMMALIREREVDIVLIAGDLFDSEFVTSVTAALLAKEMEACGSCRFFISPGNHDPYVGGGLYALGRLPKNVTVFSSEELTAVPVPACNTNVYGWAFTSARYEGMPLSGKRAKKDGSLTLVCGHADIGVPLTKYADVPISDIAAFGAHYAAFAHRHIPTPVTDAGNGALYAYCGCMEGRSFDEPGIGGAYLVTAIPDGEDWRIETERAPLAQSRYEVLSLDLTGVDTAAEIARRIRAAVEENGYGEDTFLRVIFTGATPPDFAVPAAADGSALGLYELELVDHTTPTFDAAFLEKDMTVRGELYRSLLPRLTEGSPEERAAAARALRMGLAALAGNDVTTL